jgi:hypothetical protein
MWNKVCLLPFAWPTSHGIMKPTDGGTRSEKTILTVDPGLGFLLSNWPLTIDP